MFIIFELGFRFTGLMTVCETFRSYGASIVSPFTAVCDYMEKCNYTCKPNTIIIKEATSMDSYGEEFINVNNDRIIKRIKTLMKETAI